MQLRLPWIFTRRRLIIAVIVDAMLFAFLYYALYVRLFGVWPVLSPRLALLLAAWSLTSYVVGRYVSGAQRGLEFSAWEFVVKQLIGTCAVLFLTLCITVVHVWLFKQSQVQYSFRSFLIPLLGLLAILSSFLQLTICRLSAIWDGDSSSTWTYVGSELGFQQLQAMSKWSRLRVDIKHISPENVSETWSSRYIVDRFHGQPVNVLKVLSKFQFQGSLILSRLAW